MQPVAERRRTALGYGLLVVAAGLNLRDPITSVAATLDMVTARYGLSTVGAAVLSSLPVLMLAAGAPLAPLLDRRLGPERTVLVLSLLLAAAVALRPLGAPALFLGTVVAGAAISGLSVLMPHLIRAHLADRAGLWSGVFSTSFGVSAALGAGLTVPLVASTGSLPAALAAWSIPAVALAVLAAAVAQRGGARPQPVAEPGRAARMRPTPLLWQVTAFFGSQALVFFATVAWLPTLYADRGLAPDQAAGLLALASVAGLPASLAVSLVAARLRRQHLVVAVVSLGSAVAFAGVAWAPTSSAPVFVALLGFAQGAAFGLAVALIVLNADAAVPVASFSAFAQGAGYAVAAMGPMLLGLLRSAGASWSVAVAMLIGVVAVQAVAGWAAGRHDAAPAPLAPELVQERG
jgi:CP family cyanate transporter-like MFS transporter